MVEGGNSLNNKRSTKTVFRKINKPSKYFASKKNPPNGTTVGVGRPLMVDVATASPPCKSVPSEFSAIKVVTNDRGEKCQKYVVESLAYKSHPQNHVCSTKGKNTTTQPFLFKSHSEKDGASIKGCCYSSVEEGNVDLIQKTITSYVPTNENNLTKDIPPRRAFQKIDVENHEENIESGSKSQYYSNELKSNDSYSEFQSNILPKSETLSEMEGVSKCSSKSPSQSPITGCERLL